jgi:DNA mismatch endonuclease Vsr
MSRIRGKNTTAEKIVRSLLHRMGYRFRLHVRIPVAPVAAVYDRWGDARRAPLQRARFVRPDILLPKHKTAIFVHGCFWHPALGLQELHDADEPLRIVAKLNGNTARPTPSGRAQEIQEVRRWDLQCRLCRQPGTRC